VSIPAGSSCTWFHDLTVDDFIVPLIRSISLYTRYLNFILNFGF